VKRGVFVTGTDTGVGKTLVSCALIHALRVHGVAVMPMKPIAAGATLAAGAWVNEDTLALMRAADLPASRMADVTPILLREAMAPHIAAQREGREIAMEPVMQAFARFAHGETFVVAEGVGGFKVPLGPGFDTIDLARALALPVVLVVGLRLGCLNHALLTAAAIEASGLTLAGWIANAVDPKMAVPEENVAALEERIGAPLLGQLPFMPLPDPKVLAKVIDVGPLVAP
jgi:dethiobiotin synthetase